MDERILVVDDEQVVLNAVCKSLREDDFRIDTASSAAEALEFLSDASYDVMITDLMMPGMNGLDLLVHVRDMETDMRIIMITGYPTIQTALQAKRLGAYEYITKPFTRQELRSVVVRAIRKGKGDQEVEASHSSPQIERPVYYIPENTWAEIENEKSVKVGMTKALATSIGQATGLQLPAKGHTLEQGRRCAVVKAADGIEHSLHSPISGWVIEFNPKVVEDNGLAGRDPEGEGWLFRLEPMNLDRDIKNLLHA